MLRARELWERVAERPDDDLLRLVAADMLEEGGEPEWAELVRVQVALAALPQGAPGAAELRWRERVLLARHEGRWRASLLQWEGARLEGFERGFPVRLWVGGLAILRQIAGEVPTGVLALSLPLSPGDLRDLWTLPELPWLERLALYGLGRVLPLQELLQSPLVPHGLLELALRDQDGLGDEAMALLADCPRLHALAALDLSESEVGTSGVRALVRSPHLKGLRTLKLSGQPFSSYRRDGVLGQGGVAALLGWGGFPRLEVLEVARQGLSAEEAVALLSAPGRLQSLDLSGNPLAGLRVALDGGMRLVRLAVEDCWLRDEDLRALLDSPATHALSSLDLSDNALEGAELLAEAPCWGSLQELFANFTQLGRAAACWARCRRGPSALELRYAALDPPALEQLSQAPWWDGLRSLDVTAERGGEETEDELQLRLPPRLVELKLHTLPMALLQAHLPELLVLHLRFELDPRQVQALSQAPWFEGLSELHLDCELQHGSIPLLFAGSPHRLREGYSVRGADLSLLPELVWLYLHQPSPDDKAGLEGRPWSGPWVRKIW